MKKKIIGIFVITLLIATVLPSISGSIIKKASFDDIRYYEFAPGEFIVKFTEGIKISDPTIVSLNEHNQVSSMEKVFRNSENTILDNIYLFSVPEDSDILAIVKDYFSNPNVVYAEPNGIAYLCGIPNDENFSKQWGLHNTGQDGGTPDTDVDAPEAWDIETGDSDLVISVIDSGIDYTHPDLVDNIWINDDEIPDNEIDDDENGYIDDIISWDFIDNDAEPLDKHSHGTHCAGIACAVTNNNQGIAGICWNCKIMPVRIADHNWDTTLDIVTKGIKYAADNDADVISMSFGWYDSYNLLKDAVDYAYEKGIVMVACAGNHGVSNRLYPAAYNNVIAVAGINRNNSRMHYYYEIINYWVTSNYGTWVDVAAPSQEIYSTMPTYYVTYNGILGLDMNYDYLSGTSMAAPLVAGLAALILSRNPTLSPGEVKTLICENVDPYDSEYDLGSGRVNAYKAIIGANQPPDEPTITGKLKGNPGKSYEYTFNAIDPDGDNVNYYIDWDDGDSDETGLYPSSTDVKVKHTWDSDGTYTIRAYAEDEFGLVGPEGTLTVTMPRNRAMTNLLLLRFLENKLQEYFSFIDTLSKSKKDEVCSHRDLNPSLRLERP